jgi:iron complex transport system substrate-binding protein
MYRSRLAAALAAAVLLIPAGCGDDDRGPAGDSTADPVTVKAENGAVLIESPPRRIVSISATATEDLFAVGAGKQVVAVDEFSKFPADAPRTKLSYINPNAEAIAGYRPDLVVLALESNKVVPALDRLKIPTLVYRPARDLDDAYSQIEQLGIATGHPEKARKVVARMRGRVAEIVHSVPRLEGSPTVYHELDPTYFSATSDTFVGGIYRMLGLRNIADRARKGGAFPKLSAEYVVKADPDLIVLADTVCCGQSAATLAKRRGLGNLRAVRDANVVAVPDDVASHWGPRVVDFMERVAVQVRQMAGSG